MPELLEVNGQGWKLEIIGKLPELPPFISTSPQSVIVAQGPLSSLRVYNRARNQMECAFVGQAIEPLFFEQVLYDIHLEKTTGVAIQLPPGAEERRIKSDSEHYTINFRNHVGFFDIHVTTPTGAVILKFEVFSRKVDYRTDYIAMRDDISKTLRNLAMTANARTYGLASPDQKFRPTLVEWFAILKYHFDELIKLTSSIAKKPHTRLAQKLVTTNTDRARKLSRQTLSRAVRRENGGTVIPRLGIALPRNVNEEVANFTFDTPENRYYKGILKVTYRNIRALSRIDHTEDEDAERDSEQKFFDSIRPELKVMERRLELAMNAPFLSAVGEETFVRTSIVFHKHPIYSRIEKIAKLLNSGLSFAGEIIPIGVKDTALLYEYWCFLKIVDLLRERFDLEEQTVVKINRFRTTVTLAKGVTSAVHFTHRPTGRKLHLVYNRVFGRLPTIAQKPDNVIQLADDQHFYIFDAKYRIQFDNGYTDLYGGPGPTIDDINTMHRYRDAIVLPHPLRPNEYITGVVQGAVVLFPLPDETEYQTHKFYQSIEQVEIGGIPFLPQATRLMKAKLFSLIDSNIPF